jgi:hypothetical protein
MAMQVSWWERRDAADRDALGRAALAHCRALRTREGMQGARFYWLGPDAVVLVEEVESLDIPSEGMAPDQAQTFFALADLARQTRDERWQDPGSGEAFYRLARR